MAVPTDAERPIYDRAIKSAEIRVAVVTHPRMWTGPMTEEFAVDGVLDPAEFYFTQFGGQHPLVESHNVKFRCFGGPPRETVVTRKHWFPEDSTLAFEAKATIRFEMLDPVYPAVVTVGGIEQDFGVEAEPMRVIQKGSAHVSGDNIGKIFIDSGGVIETSVQARVNTQSAHIYICRWNPAATQVPGDEILSVLYDGVIQHETSDPGFAVQPRYFALNMIQSTRAGANPTGTVGIPFFTMLVDRIEVSAIGAGTYEVVTQPTWTRPDLGNNIDTAADRERFAMDGENWAKLPVDAILSVSVTNGRDALFDEITIELAAADPEDPATTPNRFSDMRWKGRALVYDTRVRDEDNNVTSWKRQICAVIDTADVENGKITIVARDRTMSRLDTFISRAYLNIEQDADALGEIEGVNVGYLLGAIFEDLVDISDAVSGGILGASSTAIQVPEVLPQALSSGGESLLPVFTEWCDRLSLEIWRRYSTSGSARYGEIVVNLWTFGANGDHGYTFEATSTFENIVSARVHDGRDGAGQANYRQASPHFGDVLQSLEFLPTIGQFPTMPFPINDRVINDSLAEMEASGLSVLLGFPRADGAMESGGVARHRYRRENAQRRTLSLSAQDHDWAEPTDQIAVSDPEIPLTTAECWVVSNRTLRYADGHFELQIEAVTADWLNAILRST